MEKIYNFRQSGGIQLTNKDGKIMKDDMLYRSGRPSLATTRDMGTLKQLNIRSVVDLRGMADYSKQPNKPLEEYYTPLLIKNGLVKELYRPKSSQIGYLYIINLHGKQFAWHYIKQMNIMLILIAALFLIPIDYLFGSHITAPFVGRQTVNQMQLWEHYMDALEYGKAEIAEVLRLVTDPNNVPILIHCQLGKDRTGYIIALILSCIGIDDDIIIEDYAKTENELAPVRQKVIEGLKVHYGVDEHFAHANPETMKMLLTELRKRYGSISNYISSTGFSIQEQNKLKEVLLLA